MSVKCPRCDTDNPPDSKFCRECATPLPLSPKAAPPLTKTLETPKEELHTGAVFAGRYQIIEELGTGAVQAPLQALAEETGAGKVVSGTCYLAGGELQFLSSITDTQKRKLFLSFEPVKGALAV